MQKTITIPIKELNVLRKTFNEALLIINSLGGEQRGVASESRSSSSKPRETKRQAINNYKNKIALGERVKKTRLLKKVKTTNEQKVAFINQISIWDVEFRKSNIMANLVQRFHKTTISGPKTKNLLGKCLKKAFDENISDALESENILALAWKFQVPQFDEMFQDHQNHDYLPFES